MFDRIPKIVGSRDLDHAHFQGRLFVRPLGIQGNKQDCSVTTPEHLRLLVEDMYRVLIFLLHVCSMN